MASAKLESYKVPTQGSSEKDILGILKEFTIQGETFIKQQRAYMDFDKALDLLAGVGERRRPQALSGVTNNQLKRDIKEVVASMSNIRPTWTFQSGNRKKDDQVHALNKRQQFWYYQTFADRQIRQALQYAGVMGTGWISPVWKRQFWGFGKGDIELKVFSPRDVLPIQIPRNNNIQEAYCVIIREEVPLNMARAMWPQFADLITPDRTSPTGLMRAVNHTLEFLSPALNVSKLRNKEAQNASFPTVDLFHAYIMDMSINVTGKPILMGEPGTSWSYEVPPFKGSMPTGIRDRSGTLLTREATAEDCLLYPHRRLITFTNGVILRDGPSYYLHGQVPAIPFKFDDWPWEFLGFSLVRDTNALQVSATKLLRGIDDSQNARLRPSLVYDENTMSDKLMARFDPRIPGVQIPGNLQMGDQIKLLIPPAYYDIPPHTFEHIKSLYEWMKQLLGLNDLTALAKARQVPSSDSIEKLMEMAGPMVTDMSRNMESSLVGAADQWKGLAMQYYSTADRMQTLGSDGVVSEDTDYDPGTMIPSHMDGEEPAHGPSIFSFGQRAKMAMAAISTYVTPQSVHQITNVSRRMSLLLLKKAGLKIDSWTLAKAFEVENYGREPEGTKTVYERVIAEAHIDRELAQEMQAGMPQQGQGKGRPNSNQKPPHAQTKDGGSRVTMSTS